MSLFKKSFYLLLSVSLIVVFVILAGENKPAQEKIVDSYKYESILTDNN